MSVVIELHSFSFLEVNPIMAFKLTEGQNRAVIMALNWYYMLSHEKPLLAISGLAGSGKSTVVSYICDTLGIMSSNILYVALTGKAVSVLRLKGHMSNTIHKSFYNTKVVGNRVYFNKKKSIPPHIQLIVIDEFGMVPDSIIEDIISFGVPIIGLGDHGQLPPLFEKNSYLTEGNIDIFLNEVMRTDDTSGILDLAMKARKGEELVPGTYGRSRVIDDKRDAKPFSEYDVVLCWTNKSRRQLNKLIREDLGYTEKYPVKGEKIIFLNNRYDKILNYDGIEIAIVNGLECILEDDVELVDDHRIKVKARPNYISNRELYFEVEISRLIFDSYSEKYDGDIDTDMENIRLDEDLEDMIFADFAYSLGTHKSQGSEYNDILVIDEMPKFRPEYSRFLYTSITRAKNSVDVLI